MEVIAVYDDTGRKSDLITDVIGSKGFADVVVRRKRLEDGCRELIEGVFPGAEWRAVRSAYEYAGLAREMEGRAGDRARVVHCFSNYYISDPEAASLSLRKLEFVDAPYGVLSGGRAVAAMFPRVSDYASFCRRAASGERPWDLARDLGASFETGGVVDLGEFGNFVQAITGGFESRYFNSLEEGEYTVVKSSGNVEKIRAEYEFYRLLPDDMKPWFVMPFDYKEEGGRASYSMERLHMADLSIKWVHGSMGEEEFGELMDRYFYFFGHRHERECGEAEYRAVARSLYEDKVAERMAALKGMPAFEGVGRMLAAGGVTVDGLFERYMGLKERAESRASYPARLAIGHGDPCFSNALYNGPTRTLKFIDPRGALSEEGMWTNPYYDVAKLSHSVCGRYDFFNSGLFEVRVGDGLSHVLEIPFDNSRYVEIFREKAEGAGFDYPSVRVYEASLFLSMLPLHMDSPLKVLGLALNAEGILGEVEGLV